MKSFVAILVVAVCALGFVQGELKGVALLFRHGERTPASIFPKYGDSKLLQEIGMGELTLTGSKQLYENGVDLRSRYLSLLPTYFRTSQIKATSSSVPRCVASLTSFMAGFLPPPTTDKTIPFRWQSFPFAVNNEARILTIDSSVCPAFAMDLAKQFQKINSDPTVRSWLVEDKALLAKLSDFVGKPLVTFEDAFMAAETIRVQQHLETTPQWLISAYAQLQRYFVRYANLFHETDLMKKVRGGPMLTQTIDNMFKIRDKDASAHKVVIFSAHDFTLVSLLTVLGVKSQAPLVAAYGDTIAIEMHQTGSAAPEVQVYYISNSLPFKFKIQLYVPNCGTPCTLTKFNSLMGKYLVRDAELDALCSL